jgi:glyoxylate/hydroxypyruvate reductase A
VLTFAIIERGDGSRSLHACDTIPRLFSPVMKLTCWFADDSAPTWASDLAEALPETSVKVWEEGDAPSDYAVVWKPSQGFIDSQTALKAIFNAGAGVDGLACLRLPEDVPVIRLEDAGMAEQMSEYVLHAVLHHYREFDLYASQAAQCLWAPRPPRRKADYPVGILGYGVLGQAVAASLMSVGFDVVAWARTARPDAQVTVYAGDDLRDEFFRAVRILVCLLPLTPSTRGVLNQPAFATLKRGGYVINVARGGHLDLNALLAALDKGQLAGATLDVFEEEPIPAAHPIWKDARVRITPHISAATLRDKAIEQIVSKLRALESDQAITGVVGRGQGY